MRSVENFVEKEKFIVNGLFLLNILGNERPLGESEHACLGRLISRAPEQVERRALLGQREQVLGSISYIDTPHLRARRHPVFTLFSIDTKKCRNSVDRHSQCCLNGWTSHGGLEAGT